MQEICLLENASLIIAIIYFTMKYNALRTVVSFGEKLLSSELQLLRLF